MKQEKAINDPKADQFQLDYFYDMILPYSIDHIEKNGYTRVWVKDDYTIRSLEFAEGRFNREGFEHIPDFCQLNPDERGEMFGNLYFEILYEATKKHTKFFITIVLGAPTKEYDKFTPISV